MREVFQSLVILSVFALFFGVLLLLVETGWRMAGPAGYAVMACAPGAALLVSGAAVWALEVLGFWERIEP